MPRWSTCAHWPGWGRIRTGASEIAAEMGRAVERVATLRARLIEKGLIYAPKRGMTAFTVPQFDRYLRRVFPIRARRDGLTMRRLSSPARR